eukprot:scaffold18425_cov112-Isochrysis_galbana.AAC.11
MYRQEVVKHGAILGIVLELDHAALAIAQGAGHPAQGFVLRMLPLQEAAILAKDLLAGVAGKSEKRVVAVYDRVSAGGKVADTKADIDPLCNTDDCTHPTRQLGCRPVPAPNVGNVARLCFGRGDNQGITAWLPHHQRERLVSEMVHSAFRLLRDALEEGLALELLSPGNRDELGIHIVRSCLLLIPKHYLRLGGLQIEMNALGVVLVVRQFSKLLCGSIILQQRPHCGFEVVHTKHARYRCSRMHVSAQLLLLNL